MDWFRKYRDDVREKFGSNLKQDETNNTETEQVPTEDPVKVEEWVWVEGYKGTDKDMKCRNQQYELGKQYDMPDGVEIKECEAGFHLCLNIHDVHKFYPVCDNNRFFKVQALVRKEDVEKYGSQSNSDYSWIIFGTSNVINKLAAKSIKFIRELTVDEILRPYVYTREWSDRHKQMALGIGIDNVDNCVKAEELASLGFSMPFAQYMVEAGKYKTAKTIASQTDLSMDMKAFLIMK